jgi:signal transduction histidine kinase
MTPSGSATEPEPDRLHTETPLRLALIEDDPGDSYLAHALLKEAGISAQWRDFPRLADVDFGTLIRWADCVLLDLGLPDSHGVEAVRLILRRAPGIPIVVVSGNRDRELALSAVHEGAQDFLVKGHFDGELLAKAVRYAMERKLLEAEIRTLNAELEERTAELAGVNKNLEAFTYSVAHDLRTPLRGLSGFSEALLEEYGGQLDETGRGYATRIQAASERMAILIDDLLHLSRVSRAEMNLGPVPLSEEVAAVAAELASREPGRRVRFAIQDGVWVRADRGLIRSVVQNLVENAWKFTARRRDAVIEFAAAPGADGLLCCLVRDNGAGFDPAYTAKLFQPFQRLHAATDFPGTGIGLASVQRIIERHGGRVWAEGAVEAGATFSFTLTPAHPPSSGPPSARTRASFKSGVRTIR